MAASPFFDYPGAAGDAPADDLLLLRDLTEDEWSTFLGFTVSRRFVAGETIVRTGERDRTLHIVTDGVLEVIAAPGPGVEQRRIATIAAGSVVGEMAFFDDAPRFNSVRALTAGHLLSLSFERFDVLAARQPVLARRLLLDLGHVLAVRLRRSGQRAGAG